MVSGDTAGPRNRGLKMRERRGAADVRDAQQADPVALGGGNFSRRIQGSGHRQFHVRLAGAQIHIAHQNIGDRLAAARLRMHAERKRTAGGQGGQRNAPMAAGVGARLERGGTHRYRDAIAGGCLTPHRDRPIALQDRVVREHLVQQAAGRRRIGREPRGREHDGQHPTQHNARC